MPAEDQAEAQRAPVHLPPYHEFHPLALGELGVYHLQGLVAQRAPPRAVFAPCLNDLWIHARFGSDEKAATLWYDTLQIMQIEIPAVGEPQTRVQRSRFG